MSAPPSTDTSAPCPESGRPYTERRRAYVKHLHSLHRALSSENGHAESAARAELAVLRRSFAGTRQQVEAYETVFPWDPPEREQHIWLLVGGLFALHPHPRLGGHVRRRSVGAAMGVLAKERAGAAKRRFVQLVSVDGPALEHHLRQCVQLLRSHEVPLDYDRLLDHLCELMAPDPRGARTEQRQRIRLDWARDFHTTAAECASAAAKGDDDEDQENTE